jgi:uncharacterized protein YecE (DUF72 family)
MALGTAVNPLPYYLGLPLWAHATWKGSFYTANAKSNEFLSQYAQVFNAVEGSTTFYATPSSNTVEKWLKDTPDYFRFSFKFPKLITHQHHLQGVAEETTVFFKRMEPLGERLNGFMVQLPASFTPAEMPMLQAFLQHLPKDYEYIVEVRHPAFFTQTDIRASYNAILQDLAMDRIIFDSRPVHSLVTEDALIRETQRRKPRLPVQLDTIAQHPTVRYIGHPDIEANQPWLERWVAQTARWIEQGLTPRIFLHTPSNDVAPELALHFHQQLQARVAGLPDLPLFLSRR